MACVLFPFTVRDTLLRAAAAGLYQLYWSEQILEETRRNLVVTNVRTEEPANRLITTMKSRRARYNGPSMTPPRWNTERFLRVACNQMVAEVDWDSLDSGCLHSTVSRALTCTGEKIIVGVVSDASAMPRVLEDADAARAPDWVSPPALLWLYVPSDFATPTEAPTTVVVKRVVIAPPSH